MSRVPQGFGPLSAALVVLALVSRLRIRRHELADVLVVLRRRGAGTDHHRWRHRLRGR